MNFKHGQKRKSGATKLYRTHHNIIQRCTRKSCPAYANYGGRGINIHKEWIDFSVFAKEIPKCPGKNYTLERIDNSKGYIPGNIKWATRIEQANNKRNNRMITAFGKTQSLANWAREIGINYMTLKSRLNGSKMIPEVALTYHIKNHQTG